MTEHTEDFPPAWQALYARMLSSGIPVGEALELIARRDTETRVETLQSVRKGILNRANFWYKGTKIQYPLLLDIANGLRSEIITTAKRTHP